MRLLAPYFMTALVTGFICFLYNPSYEASQTRDTSSYVQMSERLDDKGAQGRPPGYALIIKAHKLFFKENWKPALVAVQSGILMLLSAALLNFFLYLRIAVFPAAAASCFIVSCPTLLWGTKVILPELALTFLVTVIWMLSVRLFAGEMDLKSKQSQGLAAVIGILSGAAVLLKPVWFYGPFALAAGILVFKIKKIQQVLRPLFLIFSLHFMLCAFWQFFLITEFHQYKFSIYDSYNLNLAALRGGQTKEAAGTPLYEFLEKEGFLKEALDLKPDDLETFTKLKLAIPADLKMDPAFFAAVNKPKFILYQLRYWPWVFIIRPLGAGTADFPGVNMGLKLLYLRVHDWVFRPFMPLLLAVSAFWLLVKSSSRGRLAALTGFALLFYFSILLSVVCYQNPVLMRWRIPALPIMLFLALAPLCALTGHLFKKAAVK